MRLSLAILLLWTGTAFAITPTISSVSGTVATGQTLTITGSNMVNEDFTNKGFPADMSYFNGTGQFLDDGGTSEGWLVDNQDTVSRDTTTKLIGSSSAKIAFDFADGFSDDSCTSPNKHTVGFVYVGHPHVSDYFIRYYVKYDVSWTSIANNLIYQKQFWTNDHAIYVDPVPGFPNSIFVDYGDTDTHTNLNFYKTLSADVWYALEFHFNVLTGLVEGWLDGQSIGTANLGGTVGAYEWLYVIGMPNNCIQPIPSGTRTFWIDAPQYGASRQYPLTSVKINGVYQSPVYLSDGSVQFKADLSGLTAPYTLTVTNNQQQTSSNYALGSIPTTYPIKGPKGGTVTYPQGKFVTR